MARHFDEKELILASHNAGKLREIQNLLRHYPVTVFSAAELNLAEPDETETSFQGNALLKAQAAQQATGKAALADDSGFAVHALKGDPGIYSARWAGAEKDFIKAMTQIQSRLEVCGDPDRRASFHCALALVWPDGHAETVEGIVAGEFVWPMRGAQGFGYDPVFVPDGANLTYGEMTPDAKLADNHRSRAFRHLVARCFA